MVALSTLQESQQQSKLGSALNAFVRDVATQWLLGKNYDNPSKEDLNWGMTIVSFKALNMSG